MSTSFSFVDLGSSSHDEVKMFTKGNFHTKISRQLTNIFRFISADSNSRLIFLNFSLRFVLFLYTFSLSSMREWLVLTAFSYRLFFEAMQSLSVLIHLCLKAGVIGGVGSDSGYGNERLFVLISFSNCALCLFTSTFVLFELFEWIFSLHHGPPDYSNTIELVRIALASLLISFLSTAFLSQDLIITYQHQLFTMSKSNSQQPNATKPNNTHHKIFQDNIPSLLLFVAAWFLSFGWIPGDPMAAIFLSLSSIGIAYPIAENTAKTFLLRTPPHLAVALSTCIREAATCEGVLEVSSYHFWAHSPGIYMATICLRVAHNANNQNVLMKVQHIFSHLITHITIQIEKMDWHFDPSSLPSDSHSLPLSVSHSHSDGHSHSHSHSHSHNHSCNDHHHQPHTPNYTHETNQSHLPNAIPNPLPNSNPISNPNPLPNPNATPNANQSHLHDGGYGSSGYGSGGYVSGGYGSGGHGNGGYGSGGHGVNESTEVVMGEFYSTHNEHE
jgi:Co/Zn/Cd efflux system component